MNLILKISFILLTYLLQASPLVASTNLVIPTFSHQQETQKVESEQKAAVFHFAKSGIEENILPQITSQLSTTKQSPSFLKYAFQNFGVLQLEKSLAKSWVGSIHFSIKEKLSLVEHRARERCDKVVNGAGGIVQSADELASFVIQNGIRSDIDLNFVITMTQGKRDLIESILLSTKEVVDGKNIQQLITHFNIPNVPSANSLSNYQTRIWYHYKKSNIPNLLDQNLSLEDQALQAFNLRNQYRTEARYFMSDRNLADFLEISEQNLVWSNYVNYLQTNKGLSGDAVWNYIINSASSGRDGVDALFKL